jgi:hypothetical protein
MAFLADDQTNAVIQPSCLARQALSREKLATMPGGPAGGRAAGVAPRKNGSNNDHKML